MNGECFSCALAPTCKETSIERILTDYTCPLYRGVPEPVYMARVQIRSLFGPYHAAEAILNRTEEVEEVEGGEEGDASRGY